MSHPDLQKYVAWYSTGDKLFPKDLELTPTALKHYFAGDGCLCEGLYARMSICNERSNKDKIAKIFETAGLTDFYWSENERKGEREGYKASIKFTAAGTENFFDYIGRDPLPGFEYKWK